MISTSVVFLVLTSCGGSSEPDREICYPGADRNYGTCFPLIETPNSEDFSYDDYTDFLGERGGLGAGRDEPVVLPEVVIDLRGIDRATRVSPHFSISDFIPGDSVRYGFLSIKMIEKVQSIYETFEKDTGIKICVSSGFRGPKKNREVGGVGKSKHILGDAADLNSCGDGDWREKIKTLCKNTDANFIKIYDSHVHCDWTSKGIR